MTSGYDAIPTTDTNGNTRSSDDTAQESLENGIGPPVDADPVRANLKQNKIRRRHRFLILATLLAVLGVALFVRKRQTARTRQNYENWMERHWETLKNKTLLNLTLPGSHNSGNYMGGLSAEHLCSSDYRYDDYLKDASSSSNSFNKTEFDKRFLPWNINHAESISAQLEMGIRYFHVKVCVMGSPSNLSQVVYNHRGYTTKENLEDTIEVWKQYLDEHQHEFIVIGLKNVNYRETGQKEELGLLLSALSESIGPDMLITSLNDTLEHLFLQGKRIAVFVKTGRMNLNEVRELGLLPSSDGLIEHWDSSMENRNLTAAAEWISRNLVQHAISGNSFYVMQANPNNADEIHVHPNMYSLMNDGSNLTLDSWENPFLLSIRDIINKAKEKQPNLLINAISTDFFEVSQPVEIALALMGLV